MSKTYVMVLLNFLFLSVVLIQSEPVVSSLNMQSMTFSEQIASLHDLINNYFELSYKKENFFNIHHVSDKNDKELLYKNESQLQILQSETKYQYIVAVTVISALAVAVIYKKGWFLHKDAQLITEKDVQKMIETVIYNDVISKNDRLNKIFDVLVSNGLTNIVVYNEHLFEIDDQFKVELREDSVKVTRLV